ncbi:MAG: glycosyltransferase [Formosimonas sp.]
MSIERVTIIIVTYNSAHCISTQAHILKNAPHVMVVDNGSSDDTLLQCQQLLPHASIDAIGRNLGFGAANNRALNRISTPYALLLNPDCTIDLAAIEQLIAVADTQPNAAICAPQVFNHNQPTLNYGWLKHRWSSKGAAADGLLCVGYASGAVMLLNMAVTRPHGFFDEAFFLYYEDDDICAKYVHANLPVIIAPHIHAQHASRNSVRTRHPVKQEYWRGYHHAQSKLLITEKYKNAQAARRLRVVKISTAVLAVVLRIITLNPRLCARMVGRVVGMWRYTVGQRFK